MVAKLVAVWLVILALSPLTAPFSTCKLSDVFGNRQSRRTTFEAATATAVDAISVVAWSEATSAEDHTLAPDYDRRFVMLAGVASSVVVETERKPATGHLQVKRNRRSASSRTILRL